MAKSKHSRPGRRAPARSEVPAEVPATPVNGASRRYVAWLLVAVFVISAALIFTRLGHYALWDDEATSALGAESVLQCGDTQAWIGHNLFAYRHGFVLHNLRIEGDPPFSAYFAAPSIKLFGENAWAARFPFALSGLATVGLLCWWVWKWRASALSASLFAIALLCNVSFFLYARQCHYYAPAMFFFCAITYGYLHWNGDRRKLAAVSLCGALLMSLDYSFYLLLAACLGVDYWVWQRKERRLAWTDWAILAVPSFIMGLVILAWWNPFHTGLGGDLFANTFSDRVALFFRSWRDMCRNEMLVAPLALISLGMAFTSKNPWLKRGVVAFVLFVALQSAISTQVVRREWFANVRYYSPLLPLSIALGAFTLAQLAARFRLTRLTAGNIAGLAGVALVFFGSNLCNGGPFLKEGLRSTPYLYVRELINPPGDPYTAAAECVRRLVPEGASVWVTPNAMIPSMIFHAPHAVYAWILDPPPRGQFAAVPPIYFEKRVAPDYALVFGPQIENATKVLEEFKEVFYEPAALLNVYWEDHFRPEIFWRAFEPITGFDPHVYGIYLLKKIDVPPPLKDN